MTRNKIEGGGPKKKESICVYIYIDFAKKKETRQVRPKVFPERSSHRDASSEMRLLCGQWGVDRCRCSSIKKLGGGFTYFLFSPLFGEDSHFD